MGQGLGRPCAIGIAASRLDGRRRVRRRHWCRRRTALAAHPCSRPVVAAYHSCEVRVDSGPFAAWGRGPRPWTARWCLGTDLLTLCSWCHQPGLKPSADRGGLFGGGVRLPWVVPQYFSLGRCCVLSALAPTCYHVLRRSRGQACVRVG